MKVRGIELKIRGLAVLLIILSCLGVATASAAVNASTTSVQSNSNAPASTSVNTTNFAKNDATSSSQAALESVLSDGERRIVSLAAFLADVAEKPYAAPFLFDDPISSLDHDFEWYVANRLAELAKSRQVLVFTHRLSLIPLIGLESCRRPQIRVKMVNSSATCAPDTTSR